MNANDNQPRSTSWINSNNATLWAETPFLKIAASCRGLPASLLGLSSSELCSGIPSGPARAAAGFGCTILSSELLKVTCRWAQRPGDCLELSYAAWFPNRFQEALHLISWSQWEGSGEKGVPNEQMCLKSASVHLVTSWNWWKIYIANYRHFFS